MKRSARIIITKTCHLECSYCLNQSMTQMDKATSISHILDMGVFEEYIITGGEPLLDISRTADIIDSLKTVAPYSKIYLYTAYFNVEDEFELAGLIGKIDGLTYTVHAAAGAAELVMLARFQRFALRYDGGLDLAEKSMRLRISPNIEEMSISPKVWDRARIKRFKQHPEDCVLPAHETLFILKEGQ